MAKQTIHWQAASASSRRWRCCSALRPGPSCARWAIAIWTTWSARPEISISASLNLQENPSQTRCAGGCGARLAIQPAGSGNNYLVIDDISGKFSFDEVTLDVVTIKDGFGGDGAAFNRPVLRVGLKDTSFQDLRFTIAGANKARGTDPGLVQTNLVSARIDGTLKLQGNVNIFTVAPR